MRGLVLNIRICVISAFVIGVTMAVLNIYPSWSQFAGTVQDPLLYSTLFLIALAFMMTSFNHKDKRKELFKIKGMEVRLEHLSRIISYVFGGVLTFSVNSEFSLVETIHFIFTAVGILLGYLMLYFYYRNKYAILVSMFGLLGFSLGFFFNLYSTSWAEVLAAFPLAIFLYKTNG